MIFDMRSVFVMCTLAALLPASRVAHADSSGVAQQYEQCGGSQYSGPTTCADGLTCTYANDSYSQCLRSDGSAALAQQYEQCGGANYDGPTTCTTGLNCVRRNENYSQCLAAGSAGGGGGGGVDTGGTPSSPPRVPGPMSAPDPANPRSSPVAGDNCEIEEGAACGPGAEFMQCCADLVASGPSFPQRFLHCAAPDGSTTGSTICRNCGKPGEQCCNNSIEGQPKAGAVGESGCAQDISPTSFNTLQGLVGGAAGTIQCREGMCLRVCDTGTGDECPEVPFCDEDPTGQNCPPIAS